MLRNVSNREARALVQARQEFETNTQTIQACWRNKNLYVVYSYGPHFPMYIYDTEVNQWVGNKDRYSRTTSNHQTATHPGDVSFWLDRNGMQDLISAGRFAEYIATKLEPAHA
jgi:hypothetical protein